MLNMNFSIVLQPGDKLPSVPVFESTPANKVNLAELFAGTKKGVIFAVPGAFTPGCSKVSDLLLV